MNDFLASILNGINGFINNYGWSMILFTLLIKLLILPLDYKSRKSMRRMSSVQPQITKLQKKYANDKEKLNQKTAELYRKEKINPMSSCLPMLLSMPILFIMFAAMRSVANTELVKQAFDLLLGKGQINEGWLWVKNLWMPDSPFNSVIADANSLRAIPGDIWQKVFATLSQTDVATLAQLGIDATVVAGPTTALTDAVFIALQGTSAYVAESALWTTMPSINLLITQINVYQNPNGWFLLPLLAAGTQVLMTITQPQAMGASPDGNAQGAASGKLMKYFFPLFTLWICATSNAAFALYWVTSNVFAWLEGLIINKTLESKEKAANTSIEEGSLK